MANVVYPKFKEAMIGPPAVDLAGGDVKVLFVDDAVYTPDDANDEFRSDIPSEVAASGNLSNSTNTLGVFDADDETVLGVSGALFEYMILVLDTGVPATSRLICRFESATGLPFTPSGNNVLCVWNPAGIFVI